MGLDLTLAPIRWVGLDGNMPHVEWLVEIKEGKFGSGSWWLAYTRLDLNRNYELFARFGSGREEYQCKEIKTFPIPDKVKFQWYEDEGIKTRTKDHYGTPLTYTLASEIKRVLPKRGKFYQKKLYAWNKAVIAYIHELPDNAPIVLWWH